MTARFQIEEGRLSLTIRGEKTYGCIEFMGGRMNVMLGREFQGQDGMVGRFEGSIMNGKSGAYFILEKVS